MSEKSKETVSEVKETVSKNIKTTPTAENNAPVVKKRGRPKGSKDKKPRVKTGGHSPLRSDRILQNMKPGDNAKIMEIQIALIKMPNIDMDDVEAVANRLGEYFKLYFDRDLKPTVAGMAIALNGHNRRWLWCLVHDAPQGSGGTKVRLRPEVSDTIKKAYFSLENSWESYMNTGKINPVAGIFLGKNNYDYVDKTETVLTPNTAPSENYSADDIRERYISNDSQKRLSDSSNSSDSDEESDS